MAFLNARALQLTSVRRAIRLMWFFGEFGSEYANGAFHARFHFPKLGRLFTTCQQESDFIEFGKKTVASCATMYLCSEPALLDRFIDELKRIPVDTNSEARLEAV